MDSQIVENLDRYKENPQVRRAVTVEGKRYEIEALLLAWNVCRYGKLVADMGIELGEWFDEGEAIGLVRENAPFYNAVKMCHAAMLRASADDGSLVASNPVG